MSFSFAVNEILEELKKWKNSDIWKSEHLKMRIFEMSNIYVCKY